MSGNNISSFVPGEPLTPALQKLLRVQYCLQKSLGHLWLLSPKMACCLVISLLVVANFFQLLIKTVI